MTDRTNTPIQGLMAIYPVVKADIPIDTRMGLSMDGNDLELSLNSDGGLNGYEQFIVTARENDYRCVYFGMYSSAMKTFLDPKYQQEIDAIESLKKYRAILLEKKEKTKAEITDDKTGQQYSPLFKIEQEETDDLDIFNSFLFFSKVFKEKLVDK